MKAPRRDSYESFRLVVALRLLSFPVEAIAVVANIPAKFVRLILLEHGMIQVDRAGRYQWKKSYCVPPRNRSFLQLPSYIPKRADTASKHIARAIMAGLDASAFSLLPAPVNAPDHGYVSSWGPVALRHRERSLKQARRARS